MCKFLMNLILPPKNAFQLKGRNVLLNEVIVKDITGVFWLATCSPIVNWKHSVKRPDIRHPCFLALRVWFTNVILQFLWFLFTHALLGMIIGLSFTKYDRKVVNLTAAVLGLWETDKTKCLFPSRQQVFYPLALCTSPVSLLGSVSSQYQSKLLAYCTSLLNVSIYGSVRPVLPTHVIFS